MAGHWVVIETASNQSFIFGSNKQAVNVGASELIRQVGTTWVSDAVRQLDLRVDEVVLASGKALLIVESPEQGKAVVRHVTERALQDAPGLQVWGVVDPEPINGDADRGPALQRAHRLHTAHRASRPVPLLRAPTLPYVKPCHYSGQPATEVGQEGSESLPRSARVHAAWRRAGRGRSRMAEDLDAERAVLSRDLLDRGVTEAGWIAVVHADGNGVGALFRHLHEVYSGAEFTTKLTDFSAALDEVGRQALADAVASQPNRADWILPIVIGGDDVTAIMDGRAAFDVTVHFLKRFEHHSGAHPVIREVVCRVLEKIAPGEPRPDGLTACAGIAYIKPHHPFSDGYHLAEQLCHAAKAVKRDRRLSALDFHVLHDSVGRSLSQLRLTNARDDQPTFGSGAVHLLRDALLGGGADLDRAAKRVLAWAEKRENAERYLARHLRVPEPDPPGEQAGGMHFTRVLDALNLLDMSRGTVEGGNRQRAEAAR